MTSLSGDYSKPYLAKLETSGTSENGAGLCATVRLFAKINIVGSTFRSSPDSGRETGSFGPPRKTFGLRILDLKMWSPTFRRFLHVLRLKMWRKIRLHILTLSPNGLKSRRRRSRCGNRGRTLASCSWHRTHGRPKFLLAPHYSAAFGVARSAQLRRGSKLFLRLSAKGHQAQPHASAYRRPNRSPQP